MADLSDVRCLVATGGKPDMAADLIGKETDARALISEMAPK